MIEIQEKSISNALFRFVKGMILAVKDVGGVVNMDIRYRMNRELEIRKQKGKSEQGVIEAKEMFETKMIRIRPRFIGALASYALLSGLKNKEILNNKGTALFRLMWFLGSAQDDFIDEISREKMFSVDKPEKLIKHTIFGNQMEFYNASYKVLGDYIEELDLGREKKHEIKVRLRDWYSFLARQEVDVLKMNFTDYNFTNCVNYREEQNFKIGSLLVVLLNGNNQEDFQLKKLERIVPRLSFRMQIVDDIGDLKEDIEAERPSYAVGALMEYADEFEEIKKLTADGGVKKVTPKMLQTHAPKSYKLLLSKYNAYGKELEEEGVSGMLLKGIGDKMFTYFPKVRDFIYNYIKKSWANF